MERLIRRFLIVWLSLLGGVLLVQQIPFSASPRLGYWLLLAVAGGSPVVVVLLLWQSLLRLRDAARRLRMVRRARQWKQPQRNENLDNWLKAKDDYTKS